jgi:gas vesicle protein
MMAIERSDGAGYLGWFLLGGVIGAAAGLLLAPRAGREMREMLAERRLRTARAGGGHRGSGPRR